MFDVDDKVRCIKADNVPFVCEGRVYTVARVINPGHAAEMIRLVEDRGDFYFGIARFEPLNPTHSNWD
jgi:hypothetical protein